MVRRRFSCLDQCIEKFVPLICSDDVVYVTWVLHIPLMWCLFLLFRKGKRAVDASDSDDSSDEEEDEKEKNNGSQVESSGLGMAHDGDSSGKASSSRGSEEEKDVVVVCQSERSSVCK